MIELEPEFLAWLRHQARRYYHPGTSPDHGDGLNLEIAADRLFETGWAFGSHLIRQRVRDHVDGQCIAIEDEPPYFWLEIKGGELTRPDWSTRRLIDLPHTGACLRVRSGKNVALNPRRWHLDHGLGSVSHLELQPMPDATWLPSFLRARELAGLEGLDLTTNDDPRLFEAIALNPVLENLERFAIRCPDLSERRILEFLRARIDGNLRHLDLRESGLGLGPIKSLFRRQVPRSLRTLDLTDCPLRESGLIELANSPALTGLKELRLGTRKRSNHEVGLTTRGVVALLEAPGIDGLERLHLRGRDRLGLDDEALASAFGRRRWTNLIELDLGAAGVGPATLRAICSTETFPRLRTLGLRKASNALISWTEFFRSPRLGTLEALDLNGSDLDGKAIRALADREDAVRLRVLDLGRNPIRDSAIYRLVHSPVARGLQTLRLWRCEIDNAGAMAIADSPELGNLEVLDLGSNRFPETLALAVIASESLRSLRHLRLGRMRFDARPISHLRTEHLTIDIVS